LQVEQAGDSLQVIFDAVMDLAQQDGTLIRQFFQRTGGLKSADQSGDGRTHPRGAQIVFLPVITDPELLQHPGLRKAAGLTGAHHDGRYNVSAICPHMLDQIKAGMLGFHHHIDHRQGIPLALQALTRGAGGIATVDLERLAVYLQAGQHQR
jgi:hypothetical protein